VDKNGKRVFPDKVLDAWQATYDKANTPASETPETPAGNGPAPSPKVNELVDAAAAA